MHFTKMHGIGNDYLYVYGEVPADIGKLSQRLSNRHFGVGADGMVYISQSEIADFKMRIFNADGSEAMMCGNGIRCVGKYVYDKGYTDKTHLRIETLSGIKELDLHIVAGRVKSATVDMGKAVIGEDIAFCLHGEEIICTPVSVGNPHAVIFVDDAENAPLTTIGPELEHNAAFADGVNVEFAQIIDESTVRMRVWERGSGVTMACGTGACACAAAVCKKLCKHGDSISVLLDGGELKIDIAEDNSVLMIGPAQTVFEGDIDI